MKAFEKWWESKEGTIDEESCPQCCNYHVFKIAWKVALERTLNSGGRGIIIDEDGNEKDIILVSSIKEELEEK